jgi:hypothetical protein
LFGAAANVRHFCHFLLQRPLAETKMRGSIQGAGKTKKVGDPRGEWVGQRPKKDQGQIYFCETPENAINPKKNEKQLTI